jgi:PAS domain-containing protein
MAKRSYEMDDAKSTRVQLLSELAALQRQVAQLEAAGANHQQLKVRLREREERFRQLTENLHQVFAQERRVSQDKLASAYEELRIIGEQLRTTVEAQQVLNQRLQNSYHEQQQKATFLESLFASLPFGVAILYDHFTILSWDRRAEFIWGNWAEEVLGGSFFALRIGLPVEQLHIALDACMAGEYAPQRIVLDAVNRQGQTIKCRVICSRLDNILADSNYRIAVFMEQAN